MCWVYVIFFARVVVFERLRQARREVRGGVQGGEAPRAGVRGQHPRNFFFGPTYFRRFRADILLPGRHIFWMTYFRDHMILGGFRHMVFADGFLFPVKELGFWTNPGHWVRVLDAAGSYMYIVL